MNDLELVNTLKAEIVRLDEELKIAKAAILDLQSKLPADWERQQREASKAMGNAAIADMRANPDKYIK